MDALQVEQREHVWIGRFRAMACPCEIHIEHPSKDYCLPLFDCAMQEALRIEQAFSRYRDDNDVWSINNSGGESVVVGEELARMLDFADHCYVLSDGLFDITSGVLREIWRFDDAANGVPSQQAIDSLLLRVGWKKVNWNSPEFTMAAGMQIDLGGIGKEYAVDRSAALLRDATDAPVLVNYGGDLQASKPPEATGAWRVGIEAAVATASSTKTIELHRGALTSSGDAQRFLIKNGIRYGHILNPKTGWPTPNAPSAVTVAGNTCLEAGILSTLAVLQGESAERFLQEQGVAYWIQW